MTSFYYDAPQKTLYVYNAGLEVAKYFDVLRIEQERNAYLIFDLHGTLSGIIFGTQIAEKIN